MHEHEHAQEQELARARSHAQAEWQAELGVEAAPFLAELLNDRDGPGVAIVQADGRITRANAGFTACLGASDMEMDGRSLHEFVTSPAVVSGLLARAPASGEVSRSFPLNVIAPTGSAASLTCWVRQRDGAFVLLCLPARSAEASHRDALLELSTEQVTLTRTLTTRSVELGATNRALEGELRELQTTHWHLRRNQEVLPICMSCARVKSDDTTWTDLVAFMRDNASFLSHGYCPECAAQAWTALDESGGDTGPSRR